LTISCTPTNITGISCSCNCLYANSIPPKPEESIVSTVDISNISASIEGWHTISSSALNSAEILLFSVSFFIVNITILSLCSIVYFITFLFLMSILSNLNKILIIRLSSIGDVVLSSHLPRLIRNNKNLNPNLQLDFLTNNSIASLFKYNSYYSNILNFDGKNVKLLNTHILDQDYDMIIDLQKNKLSRKILNGY